MLSDLRFKVFCKIDCRIQVTVYHMAASRADVSSVVHLEVFLDMTAMRACLRTWVEAVRKNKLDAVRFTFILHLTAKFVDFSDAISFARYLFFIMPLTFRSSMTIRDGLVFTIAAVV